MRKKTIGFKILCLGFFVISSILNTGCGIDSTDEGPDLDEFDSGPVISGITPEMGPPGTSVSIEGMDFSPEPADNLVLFNGTEATVKGATDTTLQAIVPDSATTGPVEVVARGQSAVGPDFMVEEAIPGISDIDPDSGVIGTEVSIHGMNFGKTPVENTITFNGVSAPVNLASDSLLVTEVPSGATTGPVEVTTGGETATGPEFTVITEGVIEVIVATSGPDPDPDGYTLVLDGGSDSRTTANNDTLFFNNIIEGSHELQLTGIAENCSVSGNNPRMLEVVAGDTTSAGFNVSCSQTTGTLQTIVLTSGSDLDPDGYTVIVDGSDNQGSAIQESAINDTLIFEALSEGVHDVELAGTANNCFVSGNNPRIVDIVAGDTTTTVFDVACEDILKNQIVFHTDRDGNQEVYVMETDGSNQTNLTNNTASDFHPAISPDGSKIVFASNRDGNDEIYIMNADGTNISQLTFTPAGIVNSQPAWSPDGTQIAFTRFTGSQNFEIFVINTDGSGETNLTNHPAEDGQPDWSPDGTQIAFASNRDGDSEIFIIDVDGNVTQLTSNTFGDFSPAWSPDGSQIAYRDESLQSPNIFIMDADGSNQRAVTENFSTDDLPDWSADGMQLVYESDQSGNLEIFVINIDGSGQVNLSSQSGVDDEHPSWSPVQ